MSTIEKQAVQLMAEEIIRAIKKLTADNNKLYVDNQIKNISVDSFGGSFTGNINASQINGLSSAIAGFISSAPENAESGDPNASKIVATISGLAAIEVGSAVIDTAQIENLYSTVADFIYMSAENAEIGDLNAEKITTAIADMGLANIGSADIGWAQIKDLVTDTAIIREGVNGKLYVDRLAVTEANMVSLTVGELVVKGNDGNFYVVVVGEDGTVTTELKQVVGSNIAPNTIEGSNIANETIVGGNIASNTVSGGNLIENTITARELNVSKIFADEALIGAIKASNIDVADLFANEAFVGKLTTNIIQSPTIGTDLDISKNASIALTQGKIDLMVSGETTETQLVLTDQMIEAIGDKFSVIANKIDLSANDSIDLKVENVVQKELENIIVQQNEAPKDPFLNLIWIDTSVEPNLLKRWDGSSWLIVNDTSDIVEMVTTAEINIDAVKGSITSISERVTKTENDIGGINSSIQSVQQTLTPDGIYNVVKDSNAYKEDIASAKLTANEFEVLIQGSESFAQTTQEANKINWIISSGDSESNVTMTDGAIKFISENIEINSNKIDLNANETFTSTVGNISELIENKSIYVSDVPPEHVENGKFWNDTSNNPSVLKRWIGGDFPTDSIVEKNLSGNPIAFETVNEVSLDVVITINYVGTEGLEDLSLTIMDESGNTKTDLISFGTAIYGGIVDLTAGILTPTYNQDGSLITDTYNIVIESSEIVSFKGLNTIQGSVGEINLVFSDSGWSIVNDTEEIKNSVEDQMSQIDGVRSELRQANDYFQLELATKAESEEIKKWARFDSNGILELGDSSSKYKLESSNTGIVVLQDGVEMTRMEQNTVAAPVFDIGRMLRFSPHEIRVSASGVLMFN